MVYGWSNEAELLRTHPWVKLADFSSLLTVLNNVNFGVKGSRTDALAALGGVKQAPPFSTTTRFPNPGIYVDFFHVSVAVPLSKIRASLGIETRGVETQQHASTPQDQRAFNDANRSFREHLNILVGLIDGNDPIESLSKNGVYTQASFEDTHSLVWTA